MSGSEFHVHGPHDHAVKHAAQGNDRFAGKIAVFTAVMATVGATFGYLGDEAQIDAVIFKNNAVIKKTEAFNQWNYYQAESNKQNLAELAMSLPGTNVEKHLAKAQRHREEKEVIKQAAEKLDLTALDWDKKSEKAMHLHHEWALATTAEQIAISLAAITLLTRKRWLELTSYGVAIIGLGLGLLAWLPA